LVRHETICIKKRANPVTLNTRRYTNHWHYLAGIYPKLIFEPNNDHYKILGGSWTRISFSCHVKSSHHGTLNGFLLSTLTISVNFKSSDVPRWSIVTYIMPVQQLTSRGDP
jgi:hypothetical protein